uniref:Uncharacterized protein n=1 Tax=Tanacetum cinerariifolium TaxID=118510 RepID=A0A6L2NSD0_TANCI|nr:hypothetical protein [Tanacetum cinerariifolium]
MGHFARDCRAPRSQERGTRENYKQGSKEEEQAPKALMAIDGVGWDWSFMANEEENHALVADEEAPNKFALMAKSSSDNEVFDNSLCSKACKKNTESLNFKITELSDKLSDTKTALYHYKLGLSQVKARLVEPSPAIESNSDDLQNRNPSVTETGASSSTILSKPAIKFMKAAKRPTEIKTNKVETVKKPAIKYAEMYRKTSKSSNFWSTARIKMTDEGTKILSTVDGKPRTISKSSIRRNLKLRDEAGISSLLDAELFENLTLMGC